MSLKKGIKKQLRSVIEWENNSQDDLFYKWSENGDEIKNASKLIIGPGQGCIFVYRGEVKSVIKEPGLIELQTDNIPFWTTVTKYMQFFESENKVGIYFFKNTKVLNQKWGTSNIIKYKDPIYNFIIGLRAFGNYSIQISNPEFFFISVVGSNNEFKISHLREIFVNRITEPLTNYLAKTKFSYDNIDENRNKISEDIKNLLSSVYEKLGFKIVDFRIEGTSFDESTMKRINRIADVSAEVKAISETGLEYEKFQQLEALRDAAKNEGGSAGAGVGIGAGISLGQMLTKTTVNSPESNNTNDSDPIKTLTKLKKLYEADLITIEEYDNKKKEILKNLK